MLRFAEVAIPGPGGFSPIFLLIILGGYVFGARIGFLLGALTMVASALITGGVGPWLPYQMLTAGWVGMTAPLCRPLVHATAALLARAPRCRPASPPPGRGERAGALRRGLGAALRADHEHLVLALAVGAERHELGARRRVWRETIQRYALFYVVTSLVWDLLGAAGNAVLMALFGRAVLRILRRFQLRFDFAYTPDPVPALCRAAQRRARRWRQPLRPPPGEQ